MWLVYVCLVFGILYRISLSEITTAISEAKNISVSKTFVSKPRGLGWKS